MKTVKLTICKEADVLDDMRIFSSIVRVAFNRYQDGMEEKEVRAYSNSRFTHNSWFIQSAIKEAAELYKLNGEKHILFGGKNNLRQLNCKNEKSAKKRQPTRTVLLIDGLGNSYL